jgi:hypothetical protein
MNTCINIQIYLYIYIHINVYIHISLPCPVGLAADLSPTHGATLFIFTVVGNAVKKVENEKKEVNTE